MSWDYCTKTITPLACDMDLSDTVPKKCVSPNNAIFVKL